MKSRMTIRMILGKIKQTNIRKFTKEYLLKIFFFVATFVVLVVLLNKDMTVSITNYQYTDSQAITLKGNDLLQFELEAIPDRNNQGISLKFATFDRINQSKYILRIVDLENKDILYVYELNTLYLQDNANYKTNPLS